MGHQLNLVGHSFGSYVVDEIAKRYPGKVNSIVALDPAANAVPSVYDPVSNDNVNFSRDSKWSWAIHSSGLGNDQVPARASEAFILNSDLFWMDDAHASAVWFFANAVMNPSDPILGFFSLDNLLDGQFGPWVLDVYKSGFTGDNQIQAYEAFVFAPDGKSPTSLAYVTNAPLTMIDSPVSGSSVSGSPVIVRGTTTDAGRGDSGIASVTVNGVQVYAGPGAKGQTVSWSATVPVFLGTNRVQVVATDTSSPNVGRGTNIHSLIYLPAFLDMPNVRGRLGASITNNLAVSDSQLSPRPLAYSLESGPAGLTVTAEGLLIWKPTSGQVGSTNTVTVRVTDGTVTTRKRMLAILEARNSDPVIVAVPLQYLVQVSPFLSTSARRIQTYPANR
jgi:hypothetical protein